MKFEVFENLILKTGKGNIELRIGQTIEIQPEKVMRLVELGKLQPDMNPNKYPCVRCGTVAGRYCLGLNKDNRFVWGWQCLRCRPYIEPERN